MTTAPVPTYFRKVVRIRATDSPNVRYALAERAAGRTPTGRTIIPGVLPWDEYLARLALWDEVMICIGIEAQFYKGATVLLYPPQWLDRAHAYWTKVHGTTRRGLALGIDTGEGVANTSLCVVDNYGIIEMLSQRTPDTSDIVGLVIGIGTRHGVDPSRWVFDRGGGGKQIADQMRAGVGRDGKRYPVQTVGFGESVLADLKRGLKRIEERMDEREDRYTYKTRRSEMYGTLRLLLDPARLSDPTAGGLLPERSPGAFAMPPPTAGPVYAELRRQLAKIPLLYDKEGQLYLPPKNPPAGSARPGEIVGMGTQRETRVTMTSLLGHSPDEADALVLAVHGLTHTPRQATAGAAH